MAMQTMTYQGLPMKAMKSSIYIAHFALCLFLHSMCHAEECTLHTPANGAYEDTTKVKREQFRKEYQEKLYQLEGKIAETRDRIKKEKKSLQENLNKELDSLEDSRKSIASKLEDQEVKSSAEWEKLEADIREEYDETESKVRNFFKR